MKTVSKIDHSEVSQALQPFDVVVNFTSSECPIPESVRCVIPGPEGPDVCETIAATAPPVPTAAAAALGELLAGLRPKLVVLADPGCSDINAIVEQLTVHCPETVLMMVDGGVDASSFMDEEDADEVAERLRQLGYL